MNESKIVITRPTHKIASIAMLIVKLPNYAMYQMYGLASTLQLQSMLAKYTQETLLQRRRVDFIL